eukprot:gene6345-7073_t
MKLWILLLVCVALCSKGALSSEDDEHQQQVSNEGELIDDEPNEDEPNDDEDTETELEQVDDDPDEVETQAENDPFVLQSIGYYCKMCRYCRLCQKGLKKCKRGYLKKICKHCKYCNASYYKRLLTRIRIRLRKIRRNPMGSVCMEIESLNLALHSTTQRFYLQPFARYAQPKIKMKFWILLLACVALCHQGVLSADVPEDVAEEENDPREDVMPMEDDDDESDLAENVSDEDEEKLAKREPFFRRVRFRRVRFRRVSVRRISYRRLESGKCIDTRTEFSRMARCGRNRLDKLCMNNASASSTNNELSTHSLAINT